MEQEIKRARALLSEKRLKFSVIETDPDPSPDVVGAIAGIAFLAEEPDVRANVYVFEDWPDEDDIEPLLKPYIPDDSAVYSRIMTNGTLLFFAITRLDTPHGDYAEDRLDKMLSAFSGSE